MKFINFVANSSILITNRYLVDKDVIDGGVELGGDVNRATDVSQCEDLRQRPRHPLPQLVWTVDSKLHERHAECYR